MSVVESSSHHTSLHTYFIFPFPFLSAALTTEACLIKASKHRRDAWIQDQTSLLLEHPSLQSSGIRVDDAMRANDPAKEPTAPPGCPAPRPLN